jgi:hypothetical protein
LSESTGYLKNGVFVSIHFVTIAKGMHVRSPKERLAQEFRQFHDFMLPPAIRKHLSALWAKKYALYRRCCIKTSLGYYCPHENFAEVAEKAHDIRDELQKIAVEVIHNRDDINSRIKSFYKRYVKVLPNGSELIPKSDDRVLEDLGRFEFDVRSVEVVGRSFLDQHPEIKKNLKSEVLKDIEYNEQRKEQQIRSEVLADVKPKIKDFLDFLIDTKKMAAQKKKVHGVRIRGLEKRLKRLSSMSKADPELSMYVQVAQGLARSLIDTRKSKDIVPKPVVLPVELLRKVADVKLPEKAKAVEVKDEDFSKICAAVAKHIKTQSSQAQVALPEMVRVDDDLSESFAKLAKVL